MIAKKSLSCDLGCPIWEQHSIEEEKLNSVIIWVSLTWSKILSDE